MYKYLILSSLIVFLACNRTNDQQISLINAVSFETFSSDWVDEVEPHSDQFQSLIQSKNTSIPLFKYIENPNYKLFIGLPINTDFDKLKGQPLLDDSLVFYTNSLQNFDLKIYKTDSIFYSEAIFFWENNLIYFLGMSDSDTIFKDNRLIDRIIVK